MSKFSYLFNRSIKFYKLNFKTSIVSFLTLTTIFFIYQFIFTIGYSTNSFFKNLSSVQNVRVYLKTDDTEKINEFIKNIKNLNSVEDIIYYTPEDSYKYLKNNTQNLKYLENISKDFFPSFIEIKLKDNFKNLIFINQIKTEINKFEIVDKASFGEQWVLKFASIKYSLQIFIFIVTILLSISIAFITINVINLNLYKFKEEIKIYSLVGATRTFIIVPFLLASVIEFILSFAISVLINFSIFFGINDYILSSLNINFIKLPNIYIYSAMAVYFFLINVIAAFYISLKFLKKASRIND